MAHWRGPGPSMDPPEPIAGQTSYVSKRRIPASHEWGPIDDIPVRVTANGEAIAPGEQSAQTLAFLGIDTDRIDRHWKSFVYEISPRLPVNAANMPTMGDGPMDHWALDHQGGMGWQMEVEVTHDPRHVLAIKDLAYFNPYEAKRRVTLWANEWNLAPDSRDVTKDRVATVRKRHVDIEPGGAIGVRWSGINDDEIAATVRAAASTQRARRDLESALHEIEVSIKVADKSWEGGLAEEIKRGLVGKHAVLSMITGVVTEWDELLHDLIPQQREAQEAERDLQKAAKQMVGETIVLGLLTFGVGSVARGLAFVVRCGIIAKRLEDVRKLMSLKILERAGTVAKSQRAMSVLAHSTRILARSAGDLTATAAIRTAQGKPITGEDVLWSLFIGSFLHGTSETAGALLKGFTKRSGIPLRDSVAGAVKGAKQEQMRAPLRVVPASATGTALESVLIAGAVGVPGEAVKNVFTQRLKRTVVEALKRDPAARRAAERVADRRIAAGRTGKDKATLVKEELEAVAGRRIDPVSDYLFGTTVGGVAKSASAAIYEPPPPSVSAPAGTVPQPVPGS